MPACLSRIFVPLLVLGACLFAGCTSTELAQLQLHGPYFQPQNRAGVDRLPDTLRRVALLPLHGEQAMVPAEMLATLDGVFASELMHTERFEVVPVTPETLSRLFGARQFSSVDALPHEFLTTLAKELDVDGVLFVDITTFTAYPPLSLGVRAKLALANTAALIWSFDTVFTTADPSVANAARRHALGLGSDNPPVDLSRTVLQSPAHFGAYVAAATFSTLPSRQAKAAAKESPAKE